MIPSSTGFLAKDFEISVQPTHTYKMHLKSGTVQGYTDGQDAMRQAIYKILSTERYQYAMYSWNYGVELLDLYGEPMTYVCPELDCEFDTSTKGEVAVTFTAHTIFGDIEIERVVDV